MQRKAAFIQSVIAKNLGYYDIMEEVEEQMVCAQYSERRSSKELQQEIIEYVNFLDSLFEFLRHRRKPEGVDEKDFSLFRPLVEYLVEAGVWGPQDLRHFPRKPKPDNPQKLGNSL